MMRSVAVSSSKMQSISIASRRKRSRSCRRRTCPRAFDRGGGDRRHAVDVGQFIGHRFAAFMIGRDTPHRCRAHRRRAEPSVGRSASPCAGVDRGVSVSPYGSTMGGDAAATITRSRPHHAWPYHPNRAHSPIASPIESIDRAVERLRASARPAPCSTRAPASSTREHRTISASGFGSPIHRRAMRSSSHRAGVARRRRTSENVVLAGIHLLGSAPARR